MERYAPIAVLFDLDDTLYDRQAAFRDWTELYVRDQFSHYDKPTQLSMIDSIISLDASGYGSKAAIFETLYAQYPALSGDTPISPADFYDQFISYVTLNSETKDLLDALKAASIPFGVITNGSQRQWTKIERLALNAHTDCLFVSDTFGCKKPDPKIFLAASTHLGVNPELILFVGDHPILDIMGAAQVGMQTAWVHRNKAWPEDLHEVKPNYTIESLGELRVLLSI